MTDGGTEDMLVTHLVVGVHGDQAAAAWVDGDRCGAGAVGRHRAVQLQRKGDIGMRLEDSGTERGTFKAVAYRLLLKVEDVDLTVSVCCSEPLAVLTGRQDVDRLFGA